MRKILIDAPGAGVWIMERAEGYFRPGVDHSFSSHEVRSEPGSDRGRILGGFALIGYTGGAMTIHMGAQDKRWFSRELAWLAFDYPFNQLRVHKLIAPVRSDNYHSLCLCKRTGWSSEAVLRGVLPGGVDFIFLTMTRDQCRWLNYKPKRWRSNQVVEAA